MVSYESPTVFVYKLISYKPYTILNFIFFYGSLKDNETTVNDVENDRDMIQGKTSGSNKAVTTVDVTMNVVCHILIALLTIYIIFKSFEEVDLYSWHPSCMAIGVSSINYNFTKI